jgi:hypothetical protein
LEGEAVSAAAATIAGAAEAEADENEAKAEAPAEAEARSGAEAEDEDEAASGGIAKPAAKGGAAVLTAAPAHGCRFLLVAVAGETKRSFLVNGLDVLGEPPASMPALFMGLLVRSRSLGGTHRHPS